MKLKFFFLILSLKSSVYFKLGAHCNIVLAVGHVFTCYMWPVTTIMDTTSLNLQNFNELNFRTKYFK